MSRPERVTPLRSVTWAVESGNRRDLLVALRDRLWTALNDDRTQPRDLSPLTLRLKELHAEIADLDAREVDESRDQAAVDEAFDDSMF